MTAPVDRVEVLAWVLYEALYRCRTEFMASVYHESVAGDWENEAPQDQDEWRAVARAALAHALELVPEVNTDWHAHEAYLRGWSACRAETLRRLGGDP